MISERGIRSSDQQFPSCGYLRMTRGAAPMFVKDGFTNLILAPAFIPRAASAVWISLKLGPRANRRRVAQLGGPFRGCVLSRSAYAEESVQAQYLLADRR